MLASHLSVILSRWQFAITALYHFLFVPLTLGLGALLAIMETIYVMTGRQIWKEMTQYWGILFGINFAIGVATGVTMEFQFGTNWSYFAQYVGDIFGAPLAIEGLMAFFLEATFIGLFFFGWEKMPKLAHLIVTWCVALGASFSALWILIANGWMQNPVGSYFDFHTMRMEVKNFSQVIFNPVAQAKFVHTISAGYVTGAIFVLAISAYYLLRKRNVEFAKRSMTVAISFGLASALSVVVLGDESGYIANEHQKMKIAAIEGMWKTKPAPASLNLIGFPNSTKHTTKYKIEIPYVLGIIATRSFDTVLPGIDQLVNEAKTNFIPKGVKAYDALQTLEKNPDDLEAQKTFNQYSAKLGYGLLLKEYSSKQTLNQATSSEINDAAWATVPSHIATLFWSFRIMVGCGFFFILLFSVGFILSAKRQLDKPWFLWTALCSLPLPWIAVELGWYIAEHGRQPWIIEGMLPTNIASSSLTLPQIITSLTGFVLIYFILLVIDIYLLLKYARLGPDGMARLYQKIEQKVFSSNRNY